LFITYINKIKKTNTDLPPLFVPHFKLEFVQYFPVKTITKSVSRIRVETKMIKAAIHPMIQGGIFLSLVIDKQYLWTDRVQGKVELCGIPP
jgi:hypothetical protein